MAPVRAEVIAPPAPPVPVAFPMPLKPAPVAGDDDEEAKPWTEAELAQVGMRTTGAFACPECKQKFDTQREVDLHLKYIHRSKSAD